MFFDTHAHYDDDRFKRDRMNLLEELPQKGISLVLNPGCDIKTSQTAINLAEKFSHVYAAAGVHPHEAKNMKESDLDTLRNFLKNEKVKAVGEIGLDFHYDNSPRELQKKWFIAQMELARECKLSAIIHDREAHGECLEIIKLFPEVQVVYHCYSGSLEYAKTLVRLGHFLSFTGAVTYKNARLAIETISWLPQDRIMLETDAPYLSPEPFRGERNYSGFLPIIAEKVAEIRDESVEEIARITTENGKRFFKID